MQISDEDIDKGGNCSGNFAKYCNNGKPKSREELLAMRNKPPVVEKPWEYSGTITYGVHLGTYHDIHPPEYDSDDYNGFPYRGKGYNNDNNFFISFHVNYSESAGISMSDIQVSNRYGGLAQLESIKINKQYVFNGASYMPTDGVFRPVPGTGGNYNSNNRTSIDITVNYVTNLGHGPVAIPVPINIVLPSLPEFREFVETGTPSLTIGIP